MAENIFEREKLYNEVWSDPVTTVAKKYKISDVAIHKICKKMNIPVPPRGYWAKIRSGEKVKRTPLPDNEELSIITSSFNRNKPVENKKYDKVLEFMDEIERQRVMECCKNITVKEKLYNPHVLIEEHKHEIKLRKEREKFREKHYGELYKYNLEIDKNIISIKASEELINKAYLIMDTLIKALEGLGCKFVIKGERVIATFIIIREEEIKVSLRESKGSLLFNIDDYNALRRNFRDTKTKPISTILGKIIIELFETSERIKISRQNRRRFELQKMEEAETRRKNAIIKKEELERVTDLINQAQDYKIACNIREYIKSIEYKMKIEQNEEKYQRIVEWIAWAKDKSDWIDPTIAKEDNILGMREISSFQSLIDEDK